MFLNRCLDRTIIGVCPIPCWAHRPASSLLNDPRLKIFSSLASTAVQHNLCWRGS